MKSNLLFKGFDHILPISGLTVLKKMCFVEFVPSWKLIKNVDESSCCHGCIRRGTPPEHSAAVTAQQHNYIERFGWNLVIFYGGHIVVFPSAALELLSLEKLALLVANKRAANQQLGAVERQQKPFGAPRWFMEILLAL